MGVRFACHGCAEPLNIKQELAGRRGVCPKCGIRFRIPQFDAPKSTPLETEIAMASRSVLRDASSSNQASVAVASPHAVKEDVVERQGLVERQGAKTLDPLGDASISTWYVRPPSGGQYGPATTDVLRQWIAEGRVSATALIWREGWAQWREAREILPGLTGDPVPTPNHFQATLDSSTTGLASTAVPKSFDSQETPAGMVGNAEIGKQRRERSIRRTLTIGALSVLSLTLIIALVAVVRSSS